MGKKRQSRDQKRKAKLSERAKRHRPQPISLAYTGNTYKKAEYVPIVLSTETGIGEADAISGKTLLDQHVRQGMESLVLALRDGTLPAYDPATPLRFTTGEEPALVALMIRRNWSILFESIPHPGSDVLIGMLRTLLSSVETFTTPSPTSRGYLTFLAGFLKKAGVSIQLRTEEGIIAEDEPVDPLIELGEDWLDGDEEARREFYALASRLIAAGERDRVAEAAQYLMGTIPDGPEVRELSLVSIHAQQGLPLRLPGPQ